MIFKCQFVRVLQELKCGRTALHIAAERSKKAVWTAILSDPDCSRKVDLSLETYSGFTAYQLALYGDRSLASELSKKGYASPLPVDDDSSDSDDDMVGSILSVSCVPWTVVGISTRFELKIQLTLISRLIKMGSITIIASSCFSHSVTLWANSIAVNSAFCEFTKLFLIALSKTGFSGAYF